MLAGNPWTFFAGVISTKKYVSAQDGRKNEEEEAEGADMGLSWRYAPTTDFKVGLRSL